MSSVPPEIAFSRIHSSDSEETPEVNIKVISKEEIKPAYPTPNHLRFHSFSILDQLTSHAYSVPFVFFYANNHNNNVVNPDVISKRSQLLKHSLSKTLVPFYPLAGKINGNNMGIECNDDGVYFVESRVNIQLSDCLKQPENQFINRLLPYHPDSTELLSKTYQLMIQINIFDCGGIAIGVHCSHKYVDGLSRLIFMKAWAATARESSEQVHPNFMSSSLFPPDPFFSKESILSIVLSHQKEENNYVTKRFVFHRSALTALKIKAATSSFLNPSSVMVVMGLLWKSFITASKVTRSGIRKQFIFIAPVNLRTRINPPLPPNSFGNIIRVAIAKCQEDSNLELHLLVNDINNAIATVNNNYVESIKGEDRIVKLLEPFKELLELSSTINLIPFSISSICKIGLYEADFGWGKPIWSCIGSRSTNMHGYGNHVTLMDTRSGDGIEAWVTMKEEDMAIFEKNPHLLSFASINPSSLQL